VFDVIVIGSGASSANAAVPLVEAGLSVLMLDYGSVDERYKKIMPQKPFGELRRTDPNQHIYFLGDDFEGISLSDIRVGSQLTPPRTHISRDAERLLPLKSESYGPLLSLARGGLGAGWGAGSFCFDADDLKGEAISAESLHPHYVRVADRIGLSGGRDDAGQFLGNVPLLPDYDLDTPSQLLLDRYAGKRQKLNSRGFYLGRTRLALRTTQEGDRGANANHDTDFWCDHGKSIYRPQWTIEKLEKHPNFTYQSGALATRFEEIEPGHVRVHALRGGDARSTESYDCKRLAIGAGVHSTAVMVLRSLGAKGVRLNLVCNPYLYIPMINLNAIGKSLKDARHSMAQLSAFYVPPTGKSELVMGQYYSYRSLLNFKLQKEAPLAHKEGVAILRALTPILGIVGIHFADWPGARKKCWLEDEGTGTLGVDYDLDSVESTTIESGRKAMSGMFRKLGCFPFQVVRPSHGSSIHYGGTFPMSDENRELTCTREGRLRGTHSVYLCDGSLWAHLPAKGLTLSLMANADRVGTIIAADLSCGRK